MKKFFPGSLFYVLPVIMLCALSCSEGSCFEETESYLKATFYTRIKDEPIAAAPDTLSLVGFGQDSVIYKKATSVKVALFPLNSSADSSTFIIRINQFTDTITFRYSSYPHLISKECGYTFYHTLDTVLHTNNSIKDIYEGNATITNLNVENIRIFY